MSETFEVRQERDALARRKVIAIAAGGVTVIVVALWIAWGILNLWQGPIPSGPALEAPQTIGTLEQSLITDTRRGAALRDEQEASLHRWSWIDRDAGVVQMPIDRAMELLEERPIPIDRPLDPAAPKATVGRPEPPPEGMAVSP